MYQHIPALYVETNKSVTGSFTGVPLTNRTQFSDWFMRACSQLGYLALTVVFAFCVVNVSAQMAWRTNVSVLHWIWRKKYLKPSRQKCPIRGFEWHISCTCCTKCNDWLPLLVVQRPSWQIWTFFSCHLSPEPSFQFQAIFFFSLQTDYLDKNIWRRILQLCCHEMPFSKPIQIMSLIRQTPQLGATFSCDWYFHLRNCWNVHFVFGSLRWTGDFISGLTANTPDNLAMTFFLVVQRHRRTHQTNAQLRQHYKDEQEPEKRNKPLYRQDNLQVHSCLRWGWHHNAAECDNFHCLVNVFTKHFFVWVFDCPNCSLSACSKVTTDRTALWYFDLMKIRSFITTQHPSSCQWQSYPQKIEQERRWYPWRDQSTKPHARIWGRLPTVETLGIQAVDSVAQKGAQIAEL